MHRYLNVFILFLAIISLFAALLFPVSVALASPLLVPTLGPTKTDAIIGDDGDGKADPGEIIEYTVTIPNTVTDATGVVFDDNPDANTTFVSGSTAASPVGIDDTYPQTVIGNVSINSALIPYSVVSNDFLGVNPTATISAFDATSTNGGQVTMTTSGAGMGQFTYNPPPGFEGTDTFTYVLTDNANAGSAASNRTATVSIPVSGMIWFINNTAASCTTLAAGCGRLSNPFSTLTAFTVLNNGSGNNPAANDNIFLYESATQYTGAVTLLSGQKLIGQDAAASLETITGLTLPGSSPAFPVMSSANGTITNIGSTVTLNTNVTVRGLQINSTTSTGLNDPAGAITGVNVSEVSVTTTTGTAVSLSSAGGTLTFTKISASGGSNGIVLNSTTGSFTVTGSGGTCTAANTSGCSGGTISNMTGSDDSSATPGGTGIVLNNASNVSLTRMFLHDHSNYAIRGTSVAGFTLDTSVLNGTNGTDAPGSAGSPYNEGTLKFDNLSGSAAISNTAISGAISNNVRVDNTSATLNRITFSSDTIGCNSTNNGEDGILLESEATGTILATVQNTTFTCARGDLFNFVDNATSGTADDLIFNNNTLSNNHPGIATGGGGTTISSNGTKDFTFHMEGNSFRDADGHTVLLVKSSGNASYSGTFTSNTIGVSAVTNSGSLAGSGIKVQSAGGGTVTVAITSNQIRQYNNFGIELLTGGGATAQSGNFNATVTGNTVSNPGTGGLPMNGIHLNGGTVPGDTYAICTQISTNTINGSGANGGTDVRLRQRQSTTVRLPGYSGANNDNTAVQNFLIGNNSTSPTALASNTVGSGGGGFTGGASCAQPITMLNVPGDPSLAMQPQDTLGLNMFKQAVYTFTNDASNTTVLPATTSIIGTHASKLQPAPVQSGGIVSVNIGTLPAGKSVTIKFRVTVNGPSLPLGTFQISNQGTISGSNFSNVVTDDPSVGGASDPTTTPVDRPDTTVLSINRAGSSPTNANSVSWTVTFAHAVLNLSSSNFTLANNGLGGTPAITGVTPVSGPPSATWTVTASTGTGDGSLGLDMANDTGLSHDVTTALPFTGQVYTIDKSAPITTSFARQTPATSLTNADALVFRVTFNEDVTGVGSADFAVTGTTATVTNITSVSTGVYDVTVGGGDLARYNGAVGLNFSGSMSITDVAGNALANSEPSTDETYTLDNSAPTTTSFTRQNPLTNPTSADTLVFRATFSEAVMGVGTDDFTVTGTTAMVTGIGSVGTGVYDVTVSGGDLASFNGIVGLNFSGALDITDLTGNALANSEPATDETYTVDNSNPTVTIDQAVGQTDLTGTSPINFIVTFNEAVTGFATGDVDLSTSTAPGTLVGTVSGGPTTYNVAVSGMTGGGTVVATIPAGVASDGLNLNSVSSSTDNTVTYDNSAPTVTINQAVGQTDPTGTGPINFTVVFSEAVTGFATGDVELSASTAPGTLVGTVSGGPTTYNVAVSGMTGDGTIIASIPAGVASDGVNLTSASTSTDNSVLYDTTNPSVTINQAAGQSDPTNGSPINFTVVFSEAVTGFATGDVDLSASTAPGTLVDTVTGGPTTYNVAITGMTGSGTITASIASGVANDLASKPNTASTSTDNTVTYDASAPTVTINQAAGQADPTSASSVNFDVVFSEAVSGFGDSPSDVTLGGTAGATTAIVTGGPITYNVAVSGMTGSGTVIASIPAAAAQDSANNNTTVSTSTDNTVTYIFDNTPPAVATILRADSNPTSAAIVHFTITFSESVTGVDPSDFSLTTTGVSSASVTGVTGAGNVYTVTVNTGNNNGTIRLDVINNGTIQDAVSNPLAAGFTSGEAYTIINKSVIFADVPFSYWANNFIERLYNAGITTGCDTNPLIYCPDAKVTRAQMAVFLLKALHGSSYVPPVATGTVFTDVPASYWAAAWIEQFYAEGITSGCGNGNYCPEKVSTTRAEMAVFLLRGKYGSNHVPPAPSGIFNDVPVSYWAGAWIEQLYAEGITSGCGNGNYCPEGSLTRAQMAVFLVKTFNLP